MGPSFIACAREQSFLMPPDVREWLPEDHFAWFVLEAVEALDLEPFYAAYRGDGRARPAYEPAMMVGLILHACARGVRSSRAIERACVEGVAYRVSAAQAEPDHATIARFVERHQDALAGVLGLCAKEGLGGVNVVAVDGSKLGANASREATVDYERLAREIIESGLETDAQGNARFGDRRGDELTPEVATSARRRQWFREARRWPDDQHAEQAESIPRDRPERVKEAKRRMDEQLFREVRAEQAYQRHRARGVDRRGGRLVAGSGGFRRPPLVEIWRHCDSRAPAAFTRRRKPRHLRCRPGGPPVATDERACQREAQDHGPRRAGS